MGSQHLEKVGVRNQGVLIEVKRFGRDADLLQFGQQAGHAVGGERCRAGERCLKVGIDRAATHDMGRIAGLHHG